MLKDFLGLALATKEPHVKSQEDTGASRKKNKYEQSAADSWHIRKSKNQEANKPDKLKEFVVERVS